MIQNKIHIGAGIGLYLGLFIILFVMISQKEAYNLDEIFSYGLSNCICENGIQMNIPEDGKYFSPSESAYWDYMTVSGGGTFNYSNVWLNQERDVHPPLFYILVHTISSFFPEVFSKWFVGSIQIIFALLTLWMSRKIVRSMGIDERTNFLFSILFLFSNGIWSAVAFFRMYMMAMFFVTATAYIFLEIIKKDSIDMKKQMAMILVVIGGTMTHYYYLIYLFFVCLVMGIFLLLHKKQVVKFVVSIGIAGAASCMIFPRMIHHIFVGGRGAESVDNLMDSSLEVYLQRLKGYYIYIDSQLFGGFLNLIIGLSVLLVLVSIVKNKKEINMSDENMWKWLVLVFPNIGYFLLVSKIAVYITDRYMFPIYSLVMISGIVLFSLTIKKVIVNKKIIFALQAVCVMIMSIFMVRSECTYIKIPETMQNILVDYAKDDCIYIHESDWRIQASFNEVRNYKGVTFFSEEAFMSRDESDENVERLVVSVTDSEARKMIFKKVEELYPKLINYKELGTFGYSTSYFFYADE